MRIGYMRKPAAGAWGLLFVMLAAGYAGTAPAPAGASAGALQKTVEAAKKEGKVVVQDLDFPLTAHRKVEEAFNRQYRLNLKIEWVPFENYPTTASQALTEHKAGAPSSLDVIRISERQNPLLANAGAIEKVDWAPLLPAGTPPEVDLYKGWSLVWKTNIYCTIFNPKKISAEEIPSSWWDLAEPKWTGKIVTVPWVQGYIADVAVWLGKMRREEVLARNEAIGKNKPIFQSSDTIRRRMLAGEIPVTFYHSNDFVEVARRMGVQLECKGMNYLPIINHLIAVRTRSPRPNAAKLFAAFMAGPEASKMLEAEGGGGNQWRPGSYQAVMFEKLKKPGLPVLDWGREPGYEKWVAEKDYENLTRAINSVLRGRK